MFTTSNWNINYNGQRLDFPLSASWCVELIQDIIGKQIQQHHHQDRHECLSWEWGVV